MKKTVRLTGSKTPDVVPYCFPGSRTPHVVPYGIYSRSRGHETRKTPDVVSYWIFETRHLVAYKTCHHLSVTNLAKARPYPLQIVMRNSLTTLD
jgi:hypothetical protein